MGVSKMRDLLKQGTLTELCNEATSRVGFTARISAEHVRAMSHTWRGYSKHWLFTRRCHTHRTS